MYTFKLHLQKTTSKLTLLKEGEVVSERTWLEARDMGTRLFEAMAEILKEQGIKSEAVEDFLVESELPDVYTSTRIAETVRKVYGFAVKKKTGQKE